MKLEPGKTYDLQDSRNKFECCETRGGYAIGFVTTDAGQLPAYVMDYAGSDIVITAASVRYRILPPGPRRFEVGLYHDKHGVEQGRVINNDDFPFQYDRIITVEEVTDQ